MSRLVVVSNRVPVPGDRNPAAGGLATGVADALVPGSLWFGWSGRTAETTAETATVTDARNLTYATIDLGQSDYRGFYTGFSNGSLYPLLLYRLGLIEFRQSDHAAYRAVNRAFAQALFPLLRPDDLVWVHDYQLLTVGHELRTLGAQHRIGFFLHTPFVPPEMFAALPSAAELLGALCACDVIGFQTHSYRDCFLRCVDALLDIRPDADGSFRYNSRLVRTIVAPIGIDVSRFGTIATRAAASTLGRRLEASLNGRPLGISVDRLDYAKGLPNRIDAIAALLARHPEHRKRVTFLQIAAPSREEVSAYRGLRRELDRAVGDVNGRYSEPDWTPIRHLTRAIGRSTLAGYYRLARLGIVTPLRDGMNLVAKEYVAAQNPADPGVLVLSRFAGAAEDMTEALLVNPFDIEAIAEAMHAGLVMPLEERQARHRALIARLRATSARNFCQTFLSALRDEGGLHE